jgi:hypothetical protein
MGDLVQVAADAPSSPRSRVRVGINSPAQPDWIAFDVPLGLWIVISVVVVVHLGNKGFR